MESLCSLSLQLRFVQNSLTSLCVTLPYRCTSSYKVVILNILNLFLNLDTVCTILVAIKLMLDVPHFASLVYKSTTQFCLSFAHDAPEIWNDLLDDVRHFSLLIQKEVENLSLNLHLCKGLQSFPVFLPGTDPAMSLVND